MHPFPARSPELAYWLLDRQDGGDAIAQHGLHHRRRVPGRCSRARCGAGRAARPPSTRGSTRRPPRSRSRPAGACSRARACTSRGFVAPAYAYTRALRTVLGERFDWWATLLTLHASAAARSPALCLGTSSPLKRVVSPLVVRAGATLLIAVAAVGPASGRLRPPAPCSRRRTGVGARAGPRGGDLRRPQLRTSCEPTGARECAATGRPSPSPARRCGATSTSGPGTRASTRSRGRTSTPSAVARSCAR